MRIVRNEIRASSLSVVVLEEVFSKRNFGWTRLEVAKKIMEEVVGLEVDQPYALQVIPHGNRLTIRLTDAGK